MLSLDLALDASSAINLIKGGVAKKCLSCLQGAAHVTLVVEAESRGRTNTAIAMRNLIEEGLIVVGEDVVALAALNDLMEKSALGAGECETILYAEATRRVIGCDDKRARALAIHRLGEEKVLGTLKLMKLCVGDGGVSAAEAWAAYVEMKNQGAFLPEISEEYFATEG